MLFSRSPFIAFAVRAMIGSAAKRAIGADAPHRLVAIHLGHHHVHQDEIDLGVALQRLERVVPVLGVEHAHALGLEGARHRVDVAHVVVDHEDRAAGEARGRWRAAAPAAGACRRAAAPGPGGGTARSRRAAAPASPRPSPRSSCAYRLSRVSSLRVSSRPGVDDDRHVGEGRVRAHLLQQLERPRPGQPEVEDDAATRLLAQRPGAPPSVVAAVRISTSSPPSSSASASRSAVVVLDQQQRAHGPLGVTARRSPACRSSASCSSGFSQ